MVEQWSPERVPQEDQVCPDHQDYAVLEVLVEAEVELELEERWAALDTQGLPVYQAGAVWMD